MGFSSVEAGSDGLFAVFLTVIRRPGLWPEAIRAWLALRGRGRLTPSRSYLAWRQYTAYGEQTATNRAHDLFEYLEWRRRMRRARKWERVA